MSFNSYNGQQMTLDDSFLNLTPRAQKIVMNSWAGDFASHVFPAIDEERFSVLYSSNKATRPGVPARIIVAALILKENSGLSDDELMEAICCDVRYQYALHTTSFAEQPISDRTFSRFRERVYHYALETGRDLFEEEMMHLAEVYSDYMNLHSNIKRMDSLMVASRCKRMTRMEIIYQTTANAVKLIHRLGAEDLLGTSLQHYLEADDYNQVIYYCKGDDVTPRLEKLIEEASRVRDLMEDDAWHEFREYQLLVRVLTEQTKPDESGKAVPRSNDEISADSLQNPSDQDATYREKAGKKHKGYAGNITETIGTDGDSLITGVSFKKNNYSDQDFFKEHAAKRNDTEERETVITDGAYNSDENQQLAAEKNIDLVATSLVGKAPEPIFADFKISEDGTKVINCPMGHSPEKTAYYPKTGMCRARFPKSCCEHCPHKDECHPKEQRNSYAIHVSGKMISRAQYLKKLSTEEYLMLTRQRNAVEGIMSVLRRRFHVDDVPVFGYIRTKMSFMMKIGAYNFNKLRRHLRRTRGQSALKPALI